ncbi:hypothetical protein, partial [Devosia insulae]|uniref:hypothetical protein n=1 Tax=Devosia insulae TaxID=408174 RepID=UPI001AECB2F7
PYPAQDQRPKRLPATTTTTKLNARTDGTQPQSTITQKSRTVVRFRGDDTELAALLEASSPMAEVKL